MKENYMVCSPARPGWVDLRPFKIWCCQILPTIFDDSMSYYECLCKVQKILNGCIDDINILDADLDNFKNQVAQQFEDLKNGTWVRESLKYVELLLEQYIPVAVFFGLTEDGHFAAYIPDMWDEITFGTTEYDQHVPCVPEYGHLILNY